MRAAERRPVVLGLPMLHDAGRQLLQQAHKLIELTEPEAIARRVEEADALHSYPPLLVDAPLLARASRLKLVAAAGSGVDHIDVAAAQAAGIVVTHAVGAGALSVAEHCIGLMLALAKRLVEGDAHVRAGRFALRHSQTYHEISGRTLTIVGYGAIGRELARIAHQGFGMQVIAVTRSGASVADAHVQRTLALREALGAADIVSVHTPLTAATRGLIGAAELAALKPGAWIVDSSRGGVIDAQALAAALDAGQVGAAALDVFDTEPPPADHPLLRRRNVLLSPHNAGITREGYQRLSLLAAQDIARTLRGACPHGLVGPIELFAASRAAQPLTQP